MVNFSVPKLLGIGVARGTATRLVSDGFLLDYTGRCLNLAARLMDKARPCGVVFSDSHAEALMEPELAAEFFEDYVYARGIAEEKPISIWITSKVKLTDADHEPIKRSGRAYGEATKLSVSKIREISGYGFHLPRQPHSYEAARVHVEYPNFDEQGKREDTIGHLELRGKVEDHPDGAVIYVGLEQVQRRIGKMPATTTSTFVGFTRTKTTYVTFYPYIERIKRTKVKGSGS
jgi:hypothetical protein